MLTDPYRQTLGNLQFCPSTLLDDLDEDLHGADEDGREGLDLLGGAGERLPVHLVSEVVCPLCDLSSHL